MEAAAAVDATAHCGLGKAFGFPTAPTGPGGEFRKRDE